MRNALVAVLLGIAGVLNSLGAAEALWLTDVHEAFQSARATQRPVLMYFTGSDWCFWCQKLDKETFATPTFVNASANWVLLKVDFPRTHLLANPVQVQNFKLAEIYEVKGFPTLVFTDSKGVELGRTGYRRVPPEVFVAGLNSILNR